VNKCSSVVLVIGINLTFLCSFVPSRASKWSYRCLPLELYLYDLNRRLQGLDILRLRTCA
jgi:hypothetical protein